MQEGAPRDLDRTPHVGDGRHLQAVLVHLSAAGDGHFGADDVAGGGYQPAFGSRLLGGFGQGGGAAGTELQIQGTGRIVIPQLHAGIQMDLYVTLAEVVAHQFAGFLHGALGRLVLPDRRAEVVAAQEQVLGAAGRSPAQCR